MIKIILYRIKVLFGSIFALLMHPFIRRNEKNIAFGAWCGELFIDNSMYLLQYAIKNYAPKGYNLYWVGTEAVRGVLPSNVHFIELNAFSSIPTLLKCKYFFFSQVHNSDISAFNVFKGAVLCFLDHGNIVKKCGMDDPGYHGEYDYDSFGPLKRMYFSLTGSDIRYDYIVVSTDENIPTYQTSYAFRIDEHTKYVKSGLPRNEILFDETIRHSVKEKYASLLGFDSEKKTIIYLPTFRRRSEQIFSFTLLPDEERKILYRILDKHNAIILEKNHFAADKFKCNHEQGDNEHVLKVEKPVNIQEMLAFCDIQISDYSGCFLDYLVVDRPIIHFLYDYEEYRDHDSGLYYPKEEFCAGRDVDNTTELFEELDLLLSGIDNYRNRRETVRKHFLTYENGNASSIILKEVLGE